MKKKPRGRPIQKGQVLNPLGAGAHDKEKKRLKTLTVKELRKVFNEILLVHPDELEDVIDDNPTILKSWVGKVILTAMDDGNLAPLMSLLDRMIGKVADNVTVETKTNPFKPTPEEENLAEAHNEAEY